MQPESSKAFPNDSLLRQTQTSSTTFQYGTQNDHGTPSASLLSREDDARASSVPFDSDAVSVSSEESLRGRGSHAGRLSSRNSSERSSPVNRVEEYERQHASMRVRPEGLAFQVIPSAGGQCRVSIEEFPNGSICFNKS